MLQAMILYSLIIRHYQIFSIYWGKIYLAFLFDEMQDLPFYIDSKIAYHLWERFSARQGREILKSSERKNSQSNLAIYSKEIERLNWKIGGN